MNLENRNENENKIEFTICNSDINTYNTGVGVSQYSTLSPISLILYIIFLIHIFEIRAQALNLNTYILLFIDNGLLIS